MEEIEPEVIVTEHAVRRYRERFGVKDGREEIVRLCRDAKSAPAWLRKLIEENSSYRPGSRVLVNGDVVLIAIPGLEWYKRPTVAVLTVIPVHWHYDRVRRSKKHPDHKAFRYRKSNRRPRVEYQDSE